MRIRPLDILFMLVAAAGGALIATYWLRGPEPVQSASAAGRSLDPLTAPPSAFSWSEQPPAAFPIPPYARFLKDVLIVLDPGHGGRSDIPGFKRGPTGLNEADVNLRVAQFLREFLRAAGARVLLTRETDVYLDRDMSTDLRLRAKIANDARADLFLSVHHNAAARDTERVNHTTVFYHASPEHCPASRDAARYVLAGLNDALRLEKHIDIGLVSDYTVYPSDGFAVLRLAEVPAVLSEASFFTQPGEEQRLRDPLYNRREAYGLFLGLARWAQAGLPRVTLVEPQDGRLQPGQGVQLRLDDGLTSRGSGKGVTVAPSSLRVLVDGTWIEAELDAPKGLLRIAPAAFGGRGPWRLEVDFENIFGQHVLHPRLRLSRS